MFSKPIVGKQQMFSTAPFLDTFKNFTFNTNFQTDRAVNLLDNFVTRMDAHLTNIHGSVDVKMDTLKEVFYDCAESLSHRSAQSMDVLDSFFSEGRQLVSDIRTSLTPEQPTFLVKLKENWLPIMINLALIPSMDTKTQIGLVMFNIATLLGATQLVLNRIVSVVNKPIAHQQFAATKQLAVVIFTMMSKHSPSAIISHLTGKMNSSMKDVKAIDDLMDLLDKVLLDWGFSFTGKAKLVRSMQDQLAEAFSNEIEFRKLLATTPAEFCKSAVYNRFSKNYSQVMTMSDQLNKSSFSMLKETSFIHSLNSSLISYKKMSKTIEELRGTIGKRVEPAAYIAVAAPGVGKTVLLCNLLPLLKKRYVEKYKDDSKFSAFDDMEHWLQWDQNASDEYHQGYIGQQVHVANELFATVDDEGHLDFLRFISPDPFLTKQAALEDKGKPYHAKLYLGSANEENLSASSKVLKCPSAINRRANVLYVSAKGSGYKQLDPDDINKLTPEDCAIDTNFDKLQVRILTYDEFLTYKQTNKFPTDHRCRNRSITELLDHIMGKLWIKEVQFASQITSVVQDEVTYENESVDINITSNKPVVYCDDINMFMTKLKLHKNALLQSQKYSNFCKMEVKLLENQYRISELLQNYPEFNDNDMFYSLIQQQNIINPDFILPDLGDSVFVFPCNTFTYAYTKNKIFKIKHGECSKKEVIDEVDEELQNKWSLAKCKFIVDSSLEKLNKFEWLKPIISGVSAATYYLSPAYITIPTTMFATYISSFLSNLYEKSTDLESLLRITVDNSMQLILGGIVCFGIYKVMEFLKGTYNLNQISPLGCDDCTASMSRKRRNLISELVLEKCQTVCKANNYKHERDCYIRAIAARTLCTQCKNGCQNPECVHNTPVETEEMPLLKYHERKLKNRNDYFSDYDSDSSDCTDNEDSSNSQRIKKSKVRKENSDESKKIKKSKLRQEDSSESKRIKKTKARRENLSDQEYTPHLHSPGSKQVLKIDKTEVCRQEILTDHGAIEIAKSLTNKLVVKLFRGKFDCDDRFISSGSLNAIGCGRYLISPSHIHLDNIPDNRFCFLNPRSNDKSPNYIFLKLVKKDVKKDIALWEISDKKEQFRFQTVLLDHLLTKEEMQRQLTRDRQGVIVMPRDKYLYIEKIFVNYMSHIEYYISDPVMDSKLVTMEGLRVIGMQFHGADTQDGDCGCLLVASDPILRKKVLGFHVVGGRSCNYASILTIDTLSDLGLPIGRPESIELENVLDQPFSTYQVVDDNSILEFERTLANGKRSYCPEGEFHYLGEVAMHRPASGTAYLEAPLHGTFPLTKRPAVLVEKDLSSCDGLAKNGFGHPDLLLTQLDKYSQKQDIDLDPHLLQILEDQIVDHYLDVFEDDIIDIVDNEQYILNGIPNDSDSHPIDFRTSIGFPWMDKTKSKKKNSIMQSYIVDDEFGKREQYRFDESNPLVKEIRDSATNIESNAKQNLRALAIFKDCLKDEPRVLHKRERPRAFKSMPFDLLLVCRKYFMSFKTAWTKHKFELNHAVGTDPHSSDWKDIYDRLRSKNSMGFDADYKNFDGNFLKILHKMAHSIFTRIMLYKFNETGKYSEQQMKEISNVLYVLFDNFSTPISVAKSTVYMQEHGNPSGSFFTTLDNCMVNEIMHLICFCLLNDTNDYKLFLKAVSILTFGDDVIYTVKDGFNFDFDSVQNIMVNTLKQTYTPADKGTVAKKVPIEQLTFLKRKFLPVSNNLVLAPLEQESIEQCFNYTQIPFDETDKHLEVFKSQLVEASAHGKEFYNNFSDKLKQGIKNLRNNNNYPQRQRQMLAKNYRDNLVNFETSYRTLLDRIID